MEIMEKFGNLEGKRLFEFIPWDLHYAGQQKLINTWIEYFKKKNVPFIILAKNSTWVKQSEPRIKLTALFKEKYVGNMAATISYENLVGI